MRCYTFRQKRVGKYGIRKCKITFYNILEKVLLKQVVDLKQSSISAAVRTLKEFGIRSRKSFYKKPNKVLLRYLQLEKQI